ncbi:hypothetical protein HK102_014139 [Quaeritorhiza haematococci]|nr:hypothetical protein HK102_014139 [Quaeritorhiza haematococci]
MNDTHSVLEGIELAKLNELDQAIRKYNAALEIDKECVDAYVARGAALANKGKWDEAIADFKRALKLDSNHVNARKYLDATREKQRELLMEKESLEKGEFLMVKYIDFLG